MTRLSMLSTVACAIGLALGAAPASAAISVCNQGASCISGTTNVNLGAFTNAPVVTGTIGNSGPTVSFTSTLGNLSTNPGAATVFTASAAPLSNLTFTVLSGFTAAEFNLERGSTSSFFVSLTDSAGQTFSQTLSSLNGSNIFNIVAPVGTILTSGSFATIGGGFADLKQLRLTAAVGAVPEPGTWALMLIGFGGMGVAMRRGNRRKGMLMQIA